jgi:crotonobetainyl-CoA:carnitine CoA-transferase CaiB-like acyl-CoA transferase
MTLLLFYKFAPAGNRDPVISPFDSYQAKDGSLVIACGTELFGEACIKS